MYGQGIGEKGQVQKDAARRDREQVCVVWFFFQAEDGIRGLVVTGVQSCALPIFMDP